MKLLTDVIRTCIGCRGKFSQKTLIRFASQKNETLEIDNRKKLHGRGAYVCRSQSCIQKAFKAPRRINALLRVQLTTGVIQRFEEVLLQWTEKSASTIGKQEELS
ncbi:YlxR family protein [Candidatus Poribacteria bacterium]|nr:YlxR family protein [Candidatus Poribacteria bacterium]MYB01951.1 YlxR family protein [Candidatus Poribacteria bacterium]